MEQNTQNKPQFQTRKMIPALIGIISLLVLSFFGGAFFSSQNNPTLTPSPAPTRDVLDGRDNPIPNTREPIPTPTILVEVTRDELDGRDNPSDNIPAPTTLPTFIVNAILQNGIVDNDNVIMRACPYIACGQLAQASRTIPFVVTGIISNGDAIEGVTNWYQVQYEGLVVYVHSSFVNLVDITSDSSEFITLTPQWNCSGNRYNCSAFDDRVTLMSYFNSCPGDPSGLDRNKDGVPCESIK